MKTEVVKEIAEGIKGKVITGPEGVHVMVPIFQGYCCVFGFGSTELEAVTDALSSKFIFESMGIEDQSIMMAKIKDKGGYDC